MADPNTCQQCGSVKTVRQSGKGRLVCQACYDIENPIQLPEPSVFIEYNVDQTKDNKPPLLYKKSTESIKKDKLKSKVP